jgi:predicted site-specific integrase-resolvase
MQGFARLKTACQYADISMSTLKNWIKDGLRPLKIKGVVLIRYADIDSFIEQHDQYDSAEIESQINTLLQELQD